MESKKCDDCLDEMRAKSVQIHHEINEKAEILFAKMELKHDSFMDKMEKRHNYLIGITLFLLGIFGTVTGFTWINVQTKANESEVLTLKEANQECFYIYGTLTNIPIIGTINNNIYARPTVTTSAVTSNSGGTIVCGGNVTNQGGSSVTDRGVTWATSLQGLGSNKTHDGTGTGSFTSTITGLTSGQTYYYTAYATNTQGTSTGIIYQVTAN
jgi:hypothetical protein